MALVESAHLMALDNHDWRAPGIELLDTASIRSWWQAQDCGTYDKESNPGPQGVESRSCQNRSRQGRRIRHGLNRRKASSPRNLPTSPYQRCASNRQAAGPWGWIVEWATSLHDVVELDWSAVSDGPGCCSFSNHGSHRRGRHRRARPHNFRVQSARGQ